MVGDHAWYAVAPSGSIRIHLPTTFASSFVKKLPNCCVSDRKYNIQMGPDSSNGTTMAGGLYGNYVGRYRADEGGSGGVRNSEVKRYRRNLESRRAPSWISRDYQEIEQATREGRGGISDRTTPRFGGLFVDPIARRLKESGMGDDRRSNGILNGRNFATGLEDREEVPDIGLLPGFARKLQIITKAMGDTISSQHDNWGDGARKAAPGVYLMSQVRRPGVVDLVQFLRLDVVVVVGGRFYSSAMAVCRIINAVVSGE